MNNDFLEIIKIFEKIKKKGYIKSLYVDNGAAGKMFEVLIDKKLDNKCLPDYKNIEIKTSIESDKYPITLFSCVPLKKNYSSYETLLYLIDNYGYITSNCCKALMINVKEGKIKYCKNHFGFMLKVSYKWKRIFLCIFHKNKIYDTSIYWKFDDIYSVFSTKLSKMVCINYKKKIIHSDKFFYYHNMHCYKLKSLDDIIFAIKNNIITINLNFSLFCGKLKYHGINFVIYEKDLNNIYNLIK